MIIQDDKCYINDTYRFLFPILKYYGDEYIDCIRQLYKQGVFIHDTEMFINENDNLFVLINITKSLELNDRIEIASRISYLSRQDYVKKIYITDIKTENKKPDKVVIVFEIPKTYQGVVSKMLEGDLKLYNNYDIEKYFKSENSLNITYFKQCRNILQTGNYNKPKIKNEILNF